MITSVRVRRVGKRLPFVVLTIALLGIGFGRLVLHLGTSTVLSESMAPTFHRGDVVITRLVDVASLRIGDVPALIPPGGSNAYVHRIVGVHDVNGVPVLTTKGDGNPIADAWSERLTTARVPVVVAVVPGLGRAGLFVHDQFTRALFIALLGLFITACAVREVLRVQTSVPSARNAT